MGSSADEPWSGLAAAEAAAEAEAVFRSIADGLLSKPGSVEEGTGFGSSTGLRVAGKIFAMLMRGELVVKLPAGRCAELVSAGVARPFDRGQGRPLREWVVVSDAAKEDWPGLAEEALAFVRPRAAGPAG